MVDLFANRILKLSNNNDGNILEKYYQIIEEIFSSVDDFIMRKYDKENMKYLLEILSKSIKRIINVQITKYIENWDSKIKIPGSIIRVERIFSSLNRIIEISDNYSVRMIRKRIRLNK